MAVRVFGNVEQARRTAGLQRKPRASEYAETFMINQTTQLPTEGREWVGTHSEAALYFGNK